MLQHDVSNGEHGGDVDHPDLESIEYANTTWASTILTWNPFTTPTLLRHRQS